MYSTARNLLIYNFIKGIVNGSASKPALIQDNNYIIEKTYYIAQYLSAFGVYLMP